jgi:hypothetical protein
MMDIRRLARLAVLALLTAYAYDLASLHPTPGRFPPVLKVPGLRAKLILTGLKSMYKAVVTLVREGPDQPMEWYESFRYQPD